MHRRLMLAPGTVTLLFILSLSLLPAVGCHRKEATLLQCQCTCPAVSNQFRQETPALSTASPYTVPNNGGDRGTTYIDADDEDATEKAAETKHQVYSGDTSEKKTADATKPYGKGEKGEAGNPGLDGGRGPPGERGEVGERGQAGNPGEKGEKGEKGPVGPRGYPGLTGPQGHRGPEGPRGETGNPGIRGSDGPRGQRGEQGIMGLKGAQGPPGDPGSPGAPGEPGKNAQLTTKNKVAFLARLKEHLGPSKTSSQVAFTQTEINIGSAYDSSNGSFMPPEDGVYIFHLQAMAMAEHIAWLAIQVNDEPVAYVWSSGYLAGVEQMGSTMTIQKLRIGDVVNVILKASDHPPNYLYAHYTLFSGYLLD